MTPYPEHERLPGECAQEYVARLVLNALLLCDFIESSIQAARANRDDIALCKMLGIERNEGSR